MMASNKDVACLYGAILRVFSHRPESRKVSMKLFRRIIEFDYNSWCCNSNALRVLFKQQHHSSYGLVPVPVNEILVWDFEEYSSFLECCCGDTPWHAPSSMGRLLLLPHPCTVIFSTGELNCIWPEEGYDLGSEPQSVLSLWWFRGVVIGWEGGQVETGLVEFEAKFCSWPSGDRVLVGDGGSCSAPIGEDNCRWDVVREWGLLRYSSYMHAIYTHYLAIIIVSYYVF